MCENKSDLLKSENLIISYFHLTQNVMHNLIVSRTEHVTHILLHLRVAFQDLIKLFTDDFLFPVKTSDTPNSIMNKCMRMKKLF